MAKGVALAIGISFSSFPCSIASSFGPCSILSGFDPCSIASGFGPCSIASGFGCFGCCICSCGTNLEFTSSILLCIGMT